MPRLQVKIGSDRFNTSVAHVNHSDKPYEIDTPYFAGRVLVLVKDFAGVTPDGSAPKPDNHFFDGRSRKFAIVIEGKFKRRDGIEPYDGDEIEFGSDFDYLPDSFPRAPLDAGLKVAKWIDPAMHYEMGEKPFIMSPYNAAVNTLCAYPAPSGLSRAVVLALDDLAEEQEASLVPTGKIDDNKKKWSTAPPVWRFLGLRGDPKVDAFIASHQELQRQSNNSSPAGSMSHSTAKPPSARPRFNHRPSSLALGTTAGSGTRGSLDIPSTIDSERSSNDSSPVLSNDRQRASSPTGIASSDKPVSGTSSPVSSLAQPKPKKKSKFSLSGLMGALDVSGGSSKNESHEHLLTPEEVLAAEQAATLKRQANDASYQPNPNVEKELGPWRFSDEAVDPAEATDFIFHDPDHTRSVAQRRKHFCASGGKNRRDFVYDPDTIYTTSFFAPFADLNTLDVKIGPVKMNISSFIGSGDLMPIRYTLRSTRQGPSPDPTASPGTQESIGFCTIEFKLVD